jgi:acyl-coenzyme A synthetase/AMP-(fatty) acid ligase
MKEVIKVNSCHVSPAELEAVLLSHPMIADAAVVGVPNNDTLEEMPRAFVVKREEGISEKEIQDFVAGKVSIRLHAIEPLRSI